MDEKALQETLAKLFSEGFETKLGPVVSQLLDAKVKELGLDKIDRKYGAFPGMDEKAINLVNKKQRIAKFIKSVFLKDAKALAELQVKGMTEGTGSAGGFLVPEEFNAEVCRIANDYGLVRKFARRLPMGTDTLNVPTEATSVSTYWKTEASAGTESNPVLAKPVLLANTLTGISTMSNELLGDANVDIVDYLMTIFAEAMAGEEDKQGFMGTGSPFTGILKDTTVNILNMGSGDVNFDDFVLGDLISLRAQVKSSVLKTSAYFMHREIWDLVQNLTENSQHIMSFQTPMVTGNGPDQANSLTPVGALQGWPVYCNDNLPDAGDTAVSTPYIVFGSLPLGLFLGDRSQMSMMISQEGTVNSVSMFETNQSAVRLTQREAIVVGLPKAFAVLKTAAS
jgi:HK97 family phage major capsid protein